MSKPVPAGDKKQRWGSSPLFSVRKWMQIDKQLIRLARQQLLKLQAEKK